MVDLIVNQTTPRGRGIPQEWQPGSLIFPCAYIIFADRLGTFFGRNGSTAKCEIGTEDAATTFNLVLANA